MMTPIARSIAGSSKNVCSGRGLNESATVGSGECMSTPVEMAAGSDEGASVAPHAAVDIQHFAGDIAAPLGEQEQDRVDDIVERSHTADGNERAQCLRIVARHR